MKLLLLQLDLQSEIPIYLQLRSQIIEGIAIGKLKPGESLPSVRQLAADLGINLHTVNKAYNILKQDGFLQIHRQKGVVVNPEQISTVNDAYLNQLKSELRPIIAEAFCRGMSRNDFTQLAADIFSGLKEQEDEV